MRLPKPIAYINKMAASHVSHLLKRVMPATTMTSATRAQEYSEGRTESLAEGKIRNAAEVCMGTTRAQANVSETSVGVTPPNLNFGSKHHVSPLPPRLNGTSFRRFSPMCLVRCWDCGCFWVSGICVMSLCKAEPHNPRRCNPPKHAACISAFGVRALDTKAVAALLCCCWNRA